MAPGVHSKQELTVSMTSAGIDVLKGLLDHAEKNGSVNASGAVDGPENSPYPDHDNTPQKEPTGEAQRQDMTGTSDYFQERKLPKLMHSNPPSGSYKKNTNNADKELLSIFENLALVMEKRLEKPPVQDGDIKTIKQATVGSDKAIERAAVELVDGKPAFAGLIRLHHSSKGDEHPHVWQGITLHAHDRPFTVRILMQHIRTVISNLHPDTDLKGLELTEVSFVWDNNEKKCYRGEEDEKRECLIQGRGEIDELVRENALVSDNLEVMMARGDQNYIYVKYRLDKVEHAEWCGHEMGTRNA